MYQNMEPFFDIQYGTGIFNKRLYLWVSESKYALKCKGIHVHTYARLGIQ